MFDFYDCVLLKHGIAWAVGTGIFLLTVLLVSRRIIGFYTSVIFMLIALGATMAVENREKTIKYWNKYMPEVFHMVDNKTTYSAKSLPDAVNNKTLPSNEKPLTAPIPPITTPPSAVSPTEISPVAPLPETP